MLPRVHSVLVGLCPFPFLPLHLSAIREVVSLLLCARSHLLQSPASHLSPQAMTCAHSSVCEPIKEKLESFPFPLGYLHHFLRKHWMTKTSPAPKEKFVKRNCRLPREKFGELGPWVASFPFYLFWECEAGRGILTLRRG